MAPTSLSGLAYEVVDVFTTERFCGNQLAIVHLPTTLHVDQVHKQELAREFNLSETVFLRLLNADAVEEPDEKWHVEIFTPDEELPFAGHPVIGAAWALCRFALSLTLMTKAGPIPVTYEVSGSANSETVQVTAGIPHNIHIHQCEVSKDRVLELQPALKRSVVQMKERFPVVSIVKGMTFVLIELDSIETLDRVTTTAMPTKDVVELDDGWGPSFVGAYFYVRHGRSLIQAGTIQNSVDDISCRMIEGTVEDPATGSAASTLAAYLAIAFGAVQEPEIRFHLVQGKQMGRESHIHVEVSRTSSGTIDRIFLSGSAVRVMTGVLL